MIRATDILTAAESMAKPSNDIDLFFALHSLLERWSTMKEVQPAELLIIKKHIPSATYSGRAYRFLLIDPEDEDFYSEGISPATVDSLEDSDALLKTDFNLQAFRRYVTSHEKGKGRLVSWAMTLPSLSREMDLQGVGSRDFSKGKNVYVLVSKISGIDLAKAAEFLCNLSDKIRKETGEGPLDRFFQDSVHSDEIEVTPDELYDDFLQSEEVLAPLTPDFKVLAVFPSNRYDLLMDF
jgi:hypothetical protein